MIYYASVSKGKLNIYLDDEDDSKVEFLPDQVKELGEWIIEHPLASEFMTCASSVDWADEEGWPAPQARDFLQEGFDYAYTHSGPPYS